MGGFSLQGNCKTKTILTVISSELIPERSIMPIFIYAQAKDCQVTLDNYGCYLQVMSSQRELQLLVFLRDLNHFSGADNSTSNHD